MNITVYVPHDLGVAAKTAGLNLSLLCREALEEALELNAQGLLGDRYLREPST